MMCTRAVQLQQKEVEIKSGMPPLASGMKGCAFLTSLHVHTHTHTHKAERDARDEPWKHVWVRLHVCAQQRHERRGAR